jgi:Xaa-Pro aminopeptidase
MKVLQRFSERRQQLRARIKDFGAHDVIVCAAAREPHGNRFVQDSSFYYFTGLEEPCAVACFEADRDVLFVPRYEGVRAQWVSHEITPQEGVSSFDEVCFLGERVRGYSMTPFVRDEEYAQFIAYLVGVAARGGRLFVEVAPSWHAESMSAQLLWYVLRMRPDLAERVVVIGSEIAALRRKKDSDELAAMRKAVAITMGAQLAAEQAIVAGAYEYEVAAEIERHFVRHGSLVQAFPSIVASGKNATILHYTAADARINDGELVVVDIGAAVGGYAADITRTYCSSSQMTDRQKLLHELVFSTQQTVAGLAQPGMFLNNPSIPEKSLHHQALACLEKHGLAHAMPHGIGHFVGLDVHDVGDRSIPLAPGDVITIEPGVYLADEGIGIRIEDDFLITDQGAQNLGA